MLLVELKDQDARVLLPLAAGARGAGTSTWVAVERRQADGALDTTRCLRLGKSVLPLLDRIQARDVRTQFRREHW